MNVHILVTVRKAELLSAALMVFPTLRVGFPKSQIYVYWNGQDSDPNKLPIDAALQPLNCLWIMGNPCRTHHEWITWLLERERVPFFVCDTDCVFWDSVEQFDFSPCAMAGRYIPKFRCKFANAVTEQRLHTALLYLNPVKIKEAVESYGHQFPGVYCLPRPTISDLVYPRYIPKLFGVISTTAFYDTCSLLYHAIGGIAFDERHLNCYDHLGFGTLCDVVAPYYPEECWRQQHQAVLDNPSLLRGAWRADHLFYEKHAVV